MYSLYKHTTPNGKIYIGITSQKPEDRWREGKGYYNTLFYRAIKKYGWDNISHEILQTGLTKNEAEQKEIELIKAYKSNNREFGYNIENGGNCKGTHSEETKRKISQSNKGRVFSEETKRKMRENHANVSGKNNPNYKKVFTPEERRALSIAHKGKQCGENNPMYGKHHSDKSKMMMSLKLKGKRMSGLNHKAKRIAMYDSDGKKIEVFESIADAERKLQLPRGSGGHISACAKGKLRSAYGYKWEYDREEMINGTI